MLQQLPRPEAEGSINSTAARLAFQQVGCCSGVGHSGRTGLPTPNRRYHFYLFVHGVWNEYSLE